MLDSAEQGIPGRKAAMKRCALCHGKLGLGARFRNIWNGRWWVHVRFCSVRCEVIYGARSASPSTSHACSMHHQTIGPGYPGYLRGNRLAVGRVT